MLKFGRIGSSKDVKMLLFHYIYLLRLHVWYFCERNLSLSGFWKRGKIIIVLREEKSFFLNTKDKINVCSEVGWNMLQLVDDGVVPWGVLCFGNICLLTRILGKNNFNNAIQSVWGFRQGTLNRGSVGWQMSTRFSCF